MLALLAIVDLERVVVAGYHGEFARVVEVEGCDGGAGARRFEALGLHFSIRRSMEGVEGCLELTLAGRNAVMTSLTFCVGGPVGGGGALGVPDPVAMVGVDSDYLQASSISCSDAYRS